MSEWSKELAWKASVPARVPWVRIPPLPPKKGNNMFDAIHKKLQVLEKQVIQVCEDIETAETQEKLIQILNRIESLKGWLNEVEEMVDEEDSHIDRTNI